MATICGAPIKARVARIVKVDACGAPVTGAGNVVVTSGFISVQASANYEDGQRFFQKNANGEPCVNQKDPKFLNWMELTANFCQVDPDAIVLMTGERLITGGSPVTGSGVVFGEGLLTARFSLEVWQPMAGAGACGPDGLQRYMYWAFMNVGNAQIGDYTFENGTSTFTVSKAETQGASANWGDGPGTGTSWLPSGFTPDQVNLEHFLFNITSTPPPTPACGATTLS